MPETARTLVPTLTPREPTLISDGGGLPFEPAATDAEFVPLDPRQPPVRALIEQINLGRQQARKPRMFRRATPLAPMDDAQKLAGWRALASTDEEVLYAKGRPPQLLTVAVRRGRKERWSVAGVSNSRPLRAARDGVRASSWRLDPDFEITPEQTDLHVLLTEQTQASGSLASERLLAPELYIGPDELVLRLYVQPLDGYVGRSRKHETPVVISLPEAVGERVVIDGALYEARS